MERTVTIDADKSNQTVNLSMTGDISLDISIREVYPTSIGDYELVSYNGDEYGFNPEKNQLVVFGPGIKITLTEESSKELDDALVEQFNL